MGRGRLEAFSDGVIAILITIMVLELKVPLGDDFAGLRPVLPVFLAYLLSFVFLGIYWVNHHHMLQTVEQVSGGILWANLNLLFWLSLVPFVTGWMGENHFSAAPTALYGGVMIFCGVSYTILQRLIIAQHGPQSRLAVLVGQDWKGKVSLLLYATAIPMAFFLEWISDAIYVAVALMWLIPDRRIEKALASSTTEWRGGRGKG